MKHAVTHGIPREDQLWKVIQKTFNKGISSQEEGVPPTPVATNQEGEPLTWVQFRALIEPITIGQIEKAVSILDDEAPSTSKLRNRLD